MGTLSTGIIAVRSHPRAVHTILSPPFAPRAPGWGWGDATLNGETLHDDYQIHFMVTQGMRDRETLQVLPERTGPSDAGAVNPAAFPPDFYIRSPETNEANHPNREVFDHFFAMELTWR